MISAPLPVAWQQRLWRFFPVLHVIAVSLILLLLWMWSARSDSQSVAPPFDLDRIRRATVLIMQTQSTSTKPVITCVASGTLVSRDGLILTSAHSTVTSSDCPGTGLMVALSLDPDFAPVMTYQADIIQSDAGLDLALLRITRDFDGRSLNPDELALPFVETEDSNLVQLDDTLWVVGYPGIGDDAVLDLRISVPGFVGEPSGDERSWFKLAVDPASPVTAVPGTMTGGGAYNREGRLVGIPTTAPVTRQTAVSECRLIQDTNVDGLVNLNDVCVPVGGSINVLRPSNFARPLIRAASLGLQLEKLSENTQVAQIVEAPTVEKLFFATSITNNAPASVITGLPAGSSSLYLFFDYRGMTPETVYELLVTIQGVPSPIFSLTPVRWSGGERGLWYIGSNGQVLPNGDYEFTLFINGQSAAPPARITVGGVAEPRPSFRSPIFAIIEGDQVFGDGYVLGSGNVARARFIYNNMQNGMEWVQIWYYNGVQIRSDRRTWDSLTPDGAQTVSIQSAGGPLPAGRYRLELYLDGVLASLADFTIAGAQEAAFPRVFSQTRFVVADTPTEALTATRISSFTSSLQALYAIFRWENLAPGTLWRVRWLVDEVVFFDQTLPWVNVADGEAYIMRLSAPEAIPDGTYRVELSIDNVVLQSQEIQLGIGQLPINPFSRAEGVQLQGQLLDAATREGIPGLTVIIISDQYSVADYTGSQDQVYALATTDRNGQFLLDRPLQFDVPYSLLIAADGYLPVPADGIELTRETPNPLDMVIYLTRDQG